LGVLGFGFVVRAHNPKPPIPNPQSPIPMVINKILENMIKIFILNKF